MPELADDSVHDIERPTAGAMHIVVWKRNRSCSCSFYIMHDQSDGRCFGWSQSSLVRCNCHGMEPDTTPEDEPSAQ